MAIRVKTIQNISNQAIEIIHQVGDPDNVAGDIPYASTGMLRIQPGGETTVEEARIDVGQLANLSKKNLIAVTDGLV
jgi:hypothetical protein